MYSRLFCFLGFCTGVENSLEHIKIFRQMSKKFDSIQRANRVNVLNLIESMSYPRCMACGRSAGCYLDGSHLVSRAESIELQTDPRNVWLHCRTGDGKGCHRRWEQNDHTMPRYKQMMEVVEVLHPQIFARRLSKAGFKTLNDIK